MNNLFSKSQGTYEKLLQSQILNLNKNVVYCTHRLDFIKRQNDKIINLLKLQKQVDDYFEDKEHIPEMDE